MVALPPFYYSIGLKGGFARTLVTAFLWSYPHKVAEQCTKAKTTYVDIMCQGCQQLKWREWEIWSQFQKDFENFDFWMLNI